MTLRRAWRRKLCEHVPDPCLTEAVVVDEDVGHWSTGRLGGLDQHGAGMGTRMFADPAILRQAKTDED
ncbi:hypothetical protein X728_32890 [Mesorhizobium sp. L103C120A0]|nr:hypothetical protein X728_32890 [Mesorhizobium sp. L103C120A0]